VLVIYFIERTPPACHTDSPSQTIPIPMPLSSLPFRPLPVTDNQELLVHMGSNLKTNRPAMILHLFITKGKSHI
jgi:hypothetical protein